MNINFIFIFLIAYLTGSIPSAVIVCKLLKLPDPTKLGSKNPGTTNVLRVAGKKAAILVLIADVLKGFLPVVIAKSLNLDISMCAWVMLATCIGHIYPIFLKFKGGKAIATSLGAIIALDLHLSLICAFVWVVIYLLTKYSSFAGLCASFYALLHSCIFLPSIKIPICILVMLIFWRHRNNIKLLVQGKERKAK